MGYHSQVTLAVSATKARFKELDALRGIAVLFVLISHYSWAYDFHFSTLSEHSFSFPSAGAFGVQLFFMISGYVIFMSLNGARTIKDFIIARFARLYPTYWFCLLFTLVVILFFPVPTLGNFSIKEIFMNFTMVQGYFKIRHIDQVYWSLGIEILFYIIMAILFYFKLSKKIPYVCWVWLFLTLVSVFVENKYFKVFNSLFILKYAPFFIIGIAIYSIRNKINKVHSYIVLFIAFCISILLIYNEGFNNEQYKLTAMPFILFSAAVLIFLFLCFSELSFLKNKYLLFFGKISYSLYLLHNVIGYVIIYNVKKYMDIEIVYIAITSVITIPLSYLINRYVEIPSGTYVKSCTNKFFK